MLWRALCRGLICLGMLVLLKCICAADYASEGRWSSSSTGQHLFFAPCAVYCRRYWMRKINQALVSTSVCRAKAPSTAHAPLRRQPVARRLSSITLPRHHPTTCPKAASTRPAVLQETSSQCLNPPCRRRPRSHQHADRIDPFPRTSLRDTTLA